jgi:hypothetical protein
MQGARHRPYVNRGKPSYAADARLGVRGCLWSLLTPSGAVGVWAQGGVARPGKGTALARTRAWPRLRARPRGEAQQRSKRVAPPAGPHFEGSALQRRLRTRPRGEAQQRSKRVAPPAGSHFEGSALQRRTPNAIVAHVFQAVRDSHGNSFQCNFERSIPKYE